MGSRPGRCAPAGAVVRVRACDHGEVLALRGHCVGTAWALRGHCARRGWDTHPSNTVDGDRIISSESISEK